MLRTLAAFVTVTGTIALAQPAWATLTVLPPRTVNLTEGETAAVAEIFSATLADEGADGTVEWSLVRLETQIIVRAQVQGGESVQMTAVSLDDLPTVARRVARALSTGLSLAETRTPDDVTRVETVVPNRTWTERAGGLFLMPIIPVARGVTIEPAVAFGAEIHLDKGSYFYALNGGFLFPTGSSDHPSYGGVFSDLGGGIHLGSSSTAPYLGAGLSGRIVGGFGDTIFGIAPYGQLGLNFDRASSARLYVELRVAQNLIPLTREGYDESGTYHDGGKRIFITEIGARVGLMF